MAIKGSNRAAGGIENMAGHSQRDEAGAAAAAVQKGDCAQSRPIVINILVYRKLVSSGKLGRTPHILCSNCQSFFWLPQVTLSTAGNHTEIISNFHIPFQK